MKAPWSSRRAAANRSVSACACEHGYFCEYDGEYEAMYISSLSLRSSPSIKRRRETESEGEEEKQRSRRVELEGTRLRKTQDQREKGGVG